MTIQHRPTFCLPLFLGQSMARSGQGEALTPMEALRIYVTILIGVTGLMLFHAYLIPHLH